MHRGMLDIAYVYPLVVEVHAYIITNIFLYQVVPWLQKKDFGGGFVYMLVTGVLCTRVE